MFKLNLNIINSRNYNTTNKLEIQISELLCQKKKKKWKAF